MHLLLSKCRHYFRSWGNSWNFSIRRIWDNRFVHILLALYPNFVLLNVCACLGRISLLNGVSRNTLTISDEMSKQFLGRSTVNQCTRLLGGKHGPWTLVVWLWAVSTLFECKPWPQLTRKMSRTLWSRCSSSHLPSGSFLKILRRILSIT